MSSNLYLYILVPALLSWLLYKYLVFSLFLSPLSKIPSVHPTAYLSSYWIQHQRRGGKAKVRLLTEAHKKHGPVILLSPKELSVASLDGLRKIYLGAFEKSDWYTEEFMNYGTPNLVSMKKSKPHAAQKRMLSHVYSKSYVQNSSDLTKLSQVILKRWEGLMKNRGEVIVSALSSNQAFGADFTSAYLFGSQSGTNFLENSENAKFFSENWNTAFKHLEGSVEAKENVEIQLMGWLRGTQRSISKRQDGKTEPVVYAQLARGLEKTSGTASEKELVIASEMFDEFIAGTETSKIVLTYLQYELSKRPELQKALRRELLTLPGTFEFTSTDDGHEIPQPDPKSLDELPFLDALLKETMRLYTPSPPLLSRIVPEGGTVIDGYHIPEGMTVGTSAHVMHMNEEVFPNAELFKPERWNVDGARKAEMMRWFWAFGSGGRMCIGSHFAQYILKVITAAIYTNFETEIVDDGGPGAMEQDDCIIASPVGNKLILKCRPVAHEEAAV